MSERHGASIRLEACGKVYPGRGGGRTLALAPSDLEIAKGEILALLGPSGCGKTTLLRMIAGLTAPDPGGRVFFDGEEVTRTPVERRSVGMVFQSYALFPNMSVAGNVGYGLKTRGVAKAERQSRVEEVLNLCQIDELAGRPVEALSGGQRQRVALARAVAIRPRALLLDEPLSALDASLREQLRDELAGLLRALSITAVFVTHDQSEAMAIADRVAVLKAGRLRQIGSPQTLYAQPADAFVAAFVGGANPLEGERRDGHLLLGGGSLALPADAPADACFFVRPEEIAIVPLSESPLSGRVERSVFLGGRCRVLVRDAAGFALTVDAPGSLRVAPGQEVGLAIAPQALMAVAPDEA
ncbi:MAG: ABC transporter ATP-binding protein [Rhodospirillales bacterium]